MVDDPYDLDRFVHAQEDHYGAALRELMAGRKETHWMWFIFPQLRGLGRSRTAHRYGIASLDEAAAYLEHSVLGGRLLECTRAVLRHRDRSSRQIFGYPDDLKFRSSMTLFGEVGHGDRIFEEALMAFCEGKDQATLELLGRDREG